MNGDAKPIDVLRTRGFVQDVTDEPALRRLLDAGLRPKEDGGFLSTLQDSHRRWRERMAENSDLSRARTPLHPQLFASQINKLADPQAIFAVDVGECLVWAARYMTFDPNENAPWLISKAWSVSEKLSTGYVRANIDTEWGSVPVRGSSRLPVPAERSAINAPMQGTAADIIKRAMIEVAAWLEAEAPRAKLIMQVHDELVGEVPDDRADDVGAHVARIMEGAAELRVPLRVDLGLGNNWDEAH